MPKIRPFCVAVFASADAASESPMPLKHDHSTFHKTM